MTEDTTWATGSSDLGSADSSGVDPELDAQPDPGVVRVLGEVEALDGRPVAEHVEVYETAHATLRRALDDRTD